MSESSVRGPQASLTPELPYKPMVKNGADTRAPKAGVMRSPEATVVTNGDVVGFFGHKRRLPPASPKDNHIAMRNFRPPNIEVLSDGCPSPTIEMTPPVDQQKRIKSRMDWDRTLFNFHQEAASASAGEQSSAEAGRQLPRPGLGGGTLPETSLPAGLTEPSTPTTPHTPLTPSGKPRPIRKSVSFQNNLGSEGAGDKGGSKSRSVSVSETEAEVTPRRRSTTKVPPLLGRKSFSNFSFPSTFSFRSADGRASSMSSTVNGARTSAIDVEAAASHRIQCRFTETHRKVLVGLLVMTVGAVLWVGTTQCLVKLYSWPSFYAPFFIVYFSSAWTIIFFPIYLVGRIFKTRCKLSVLDTIRDNFRVYTQDALAPCAPHKVLAKCAVFCVIWTLTCYVYIRALSFKSALDVSALFATNSNFVYLMSWIVLQKKFIAVRIVSFIVAMTGIIMITYVEAGFASDDMWGSVLVMISTAGAGAYKVLFRKIIGEVTYGQVSMFITCLGFSSCLMMWPFLLVFYFTNTEPIVWAEVPWPLLCGAAAFAFGLNVVLTYGSIVTYHTCVQASLVFAIPVCVGYEVIFNRSTFSVVGMQIGAYVLIGFSFLLNILPEDWHETVLKALHWKQHQSRPEDAHMTPRQRVRSSVRQL